MRTWKQAAALTLSVLLTVSAAFPALAVEKPADMDDATWARLQDNTLEYDEIENLVLYYNPTYRQVVDTIEVQLDPLKTAVADLKDYVQRPDPQNHDFCDRGSGDHVSSDPGFEGTGGYFCGVSPGGL